MPNYHDMKTGKVIPLQDFITAIHNQLEIEKQKPEPNLETVKEILGIIDSSIAELQRIKLERGKDG